MMLKRTQECQNQWLLMRINGYEKFAQKNLLQMPLKLGGHGKIVHIDESLFRHKPKVCDKHSC